MEILEVKKVFEIILNVVFFVILSLLVKKIILKLYFFYLRFNILFFLVYVIKY